jgi:feruloyl esterase
MTIRTPGLLLVALSAFLVAGTARQAQADPGTATASQPAGGTGSITVADGAEACAALRGTAVPKTEIALPTRGALITSAELRAPSAGGAPEYCEAKGSILAADPADPPILFQLNLPTVWNRGAFQFGGGGFNGTVVSGLGNAPHAPAGSATPLARGYLTFGDDSGHQEHPLSGRFGLNDQALANYGGESVKRSHDMAEALARRYYGRTPDRFYFGGGSKGGHEGLVAAQRYGTDYDGVIAYYPANQNQAMSLSWFRMWEAAYRRDGGTLTVAQRRLVQDGVLKACDRLDGAADGIVANLAACDRAFSVKSLACDDASAPDGTCLSPTQIATLNTAATTMRFAFPLANGVRSIGPYPIFQGADDSPWFGDGTTPDGAATSYGFFTDQVIRHFIQRDPASSTAGFDYRDWRPRVQQISRLADATDPDLDAFRAHGGKLILVQGTGDMLVTHTTTSAYFDTVRARYGNGASRFARYYLVPGFAHGGGAFPMTWDSLTALERWAEDGRPPTRPVTVAGDRSRPLCEYPLWPRYKGHGDMNQASSFRCTAEGER